MTSVLDSFCANGYVKINNANIVPVLRVNYGIGSEPQKYQAAAMSQLYGGKGIPIIDFGAPKAWSVNGTAYRASIEFERKLNDRIFYQMLPKSAPKEVEVTVLQPVEALTPDGPIVAMHVQEEFEELLPLCYGVPKMETVFVEPHREAVECFKLSSSRLEAGVYEQEDFDLTDLVPVDATTFSDIGCPLPFQSPVMENFLPCGGKPLNFRLYNAKIEVSYFRHRLCKLFLACANVESHGEQMSINWASSKSRDKALAYVKLALSALVLVPAYPKRYHINADEISSEIVYSIIPYDAGRYMLCFNKGQHSAYLEADSAWHVGACVQAFYQAYRDSPKMGSNRRWGRLSDVNKWLTTYSVPTFRDKCGTFYAQYRLLPVVGNTDFRVLGAGFNEGMASMCAYYIGQHIRSLEGPMRRNPFYRSMPPDELKATIGSGQVGKCKREFVVFVRSYEDDTCCWAISLSFKVKGVLHTVQSTYGANISDMIEASMMCPVGSALGCLHGKVVSMPLHKSRAVVDCKQVAATISRVDDLL